MVINHIGLPRIFYYPDDGTHSGVSSGNTSSTPVPAKTILPILTSPTTPQEVALSSHPITTLKNRIGAERHDAMKPVISIQFLSIQLKKELCKLLETERGVLELIFNLPDDEIAQFSDATEKLCRLAEQAETIVLNDPTQYESQRKAINNFIDTQLLGIINNSTGFAEPGSIKSISSYMSFISEGLNAFSQTDQVQLCTNFCTDILDHLSLTSRFLNTIKKFDSGYIGEPKIVDINSSIRDALLYFANDKVNAYLKLDPLEDFDLRTKEQQLQVLIDPDLLCKVWLNLGTNSAEACIQNGQQGVPFVIIACSSSDKRYTEIKVIDKGPGINPQEIADPSMILLRGVSTKATKENEGLGMDIINQIIVSAGGTIQVESEFGTENSGTTITIRLPIANQ